ncbi:hypothetical protein NDU88_008868 [Pleurodeles waltl]|uniref:Uncharacterized protein n=1 Tax=Pleurodeles waltl TaxID=8319 RepID=A0AAV7QRY5_PLEWA|nr:hypothetical protein NDU88_008868 [Pleurodeles waltl]
MTATPTKENTIMDFEKVPWWLRPPVSRELGHSGARTIGKRTRLAACAVSGAGRPTPGATALVPGLNVPAEVSGDCRRRMLESCAVPVQLGTCAAARRLPEDRS